MKEFKNGMFRETDINRSVTVFGWVNKRRDMGGVIFVDLRDKSGILQVVFNRSFLKDDFKLAEGLKNEYCIKVVGKISLRDEDMFNPLLETGKVELIAEQLEVLSEAHPVPFNIYENSDINESVSLKYRYLDLRREKLQRNIILRSKVNSLIRKYMESDDFLEIETPILCKSTPEGARDYIVPSRISVGSFYALPQSPQIFKQLLMISGFEKYYQLARCFRDEDLRADRQPEFTQLDLEMSFANEEDVIDVVEGLLKYIVKEVRGEELSNFPRISYKEAMDRYGSEKPDIRFDMELCDLTDIFKDTSMNVFRSAIEKGGIAKCLIVKNNGDKYSRSDVEHLTDFVKIYGAKGLAWLKYDNDMFNGVIAKNLEEEKLEVIKNKYGVSNNDLILIVADEKKVVYDSLGALRVKIGKELGLIDEKKLGFIWVTDFPMFEWDKTDNRFKSVHHPFTAPKNLQDIFDKENCLSKAYDIILNGYELGGGSVRIHDPKVQKIVFDALGLSEEDIENKFGFFIDAFKYGAPPHAGLAIGIERLIMILAGTDNIKDVVAFPKTQSASDLMCEAPSMVSHSQLKELGIKLEVKDNE